MIAAVMSFRWGMAAVAARQGTGIMPPSTWKIRP
jgi:hypothetical protein